LSVTRIGGVGQNKRQQDFGVKTLRAVAAYNQAHEFAQFGSEMGPEAVRYLEKGLQLREIFTQTPGETYDLVSQQLMMDIIHNLEDGLKLDVGTMKQAVREFALKVKDDAEYDAVRDELIKKSTTKKDKEEAKK
jgi:F0F1-type ATP synthase alpha subunit